MKADIQIRISENAMPNDRFTPESRHSPDKLLNDR
jgi:hypothetical protein